MANLATPAVLRVFDAINSGDLSCLEECVTADFVDHGSPVPVPAGPDGYRRILSWVTQTLRIRYELEEMVQTEDRIVIRATAHGRATPPMQPPEVAGQPYAMSTIHFFRTKGAKLAEHWGVRDELGVLVQLGVLPSPQLD